MDRLRKSVRTHAPRPLLRAYRGARGTWDRNDLLFDRRASLGAMASDYFRLDGTHGYFTYDDACVFSVLLRTQTLAGVADDILEIGSYFGKSTAFMAAGLAPGEQLLVCDVFGGPSDDSYAGAPRPEDVLRAVRTLTPDFADDRIAFHEGSSAGLNLTGRSFRFAHIDGGHGYERTLADLNLVAPHVIDEGIIAMDDYQHVDWPEVTEAVHDFLRNSGFGVLADVNRLGCRGRKLYLSR
jgi:hypothetical protein